MRVLVTGGAGYIGATLFRQVAPSAAVSRVGAAPVFAEVDAETWSLDPVDVEYRLTLRMRAIIAVKALGHPCDYEALERIRLPIIEDAEETYDAYYKGRPVPALGKIVVFSFPTDKTISTGEGACVTTNDRTLAECDPRLDHAETNRAGRYWHDESDYDPRMTKAQTAIGRASVERWAELAPARATSTAACDRGLASLPVKRRPAAPWATESTGLSTIAIAVAEVVRGKAADAG